MFVLRFKRKKGFSLVELIITIGVIGILSSVVLTSVTKMREKAYFARAKADMKSMALALELYASEHSNNYPADVSRDLPAGLESYLGGGTWPKASWPGSIFDWDNWNDPVTGKKIYQISVRFCPVGGEITDCNFPKETWANEFGLNSAVYYCIKGACRSHINESVDYPGYCLNC